MKRILLINTRSLGLLIILAAFPLLGPQQTTLSDVIHAQRVNSISVPISQQDLLEEIPFWKGFIDSLWIPVDAIFLDSSTVVIADMRDGRLVIVNGIRAEMRAVGRRGNGPGEFQAPVGLGVGNQGFFVWDMIAFRFSGFDLSGVFTNSYPVMIPSRGVLSSICVTGWGDVAFAPQMAKTGDKFFGQILFFTSSLDSFWTVDIPCSKLRDEKTDPSERAVCNMTVAWGSGETMLVGFHNDYTIRRYSHEGEIVWEYGPFDPRFRPAKFEASAEEGTASIFMTNQITGLWEIDGYGILAGVGITEDYQFTGNYLTFLDVIIPEEGIIQRIPIPNGWEVRDVWCSDGEVRLLTMLFDNINPLHFAIYSAPLDSLFHN